MKPLPTIHDDAIAIAPLSSVKPVRSATIKKMTKAIPAPPDDETLQRLNAIAKQYPFCVHYREKNNRIL